MDSFTDSTWFPIHNYVGNELAHLVVHGHHAGRQQPPEVEAFPLRPQEGGAFVHQGVGKHRLAQLSHVRRQFLTSIPTKSTNVTNVQKYQVFQVSHGVYGTKTQNNKIGQVLLRHNKNIIKTRRKKMHGRKKETKTNVDTKNTRTHTHTHKNMDKTKHSNSQIQSRRGNLFFKCSRCFSERKQKIITRHKKNGEMLRRWLVVMERVIAPPPFGDRQK